MDWYEDDEMMRQWEDVCNEEEKITRKQMGKERAYQLKEC